MVVIKDEHDDWCGPEFPVLVIFNESKRTMLQCPATVALGVEVTHFFDLQGALVGNCFSIPLAEDETMVLAVQLLGNLAALFTVFQCHSAANRKPHQTVLQQLSLNTVFGNTADHIFQLPKP